MLGRVAMADEGAPLVAAHLHPVALDDPAVGKRKLRHQSSVAIAAAAHRRGALGSEPVLAEDFEHRLGGVAGARPAHRVRGQVLALRGPELGAELLHQPRGVAGVVRVVVRQDDPLDLLLQKNLFPQRPGGVVADAGVDDGVMPTSQRLMWSSANGSGMLSQRTPGATSMRRARRWAFGIRVVERRHPARIARNPTCKSRNGTRRVLDQRAGARVRGHAARHPLLRGPGPDLAAPRRPAAIYTPRDRTRLKLDPARQAPRPVAVRDPRADRHVRARTRRAAAARALPRASLESHKASLLQQRTDIEALAPGNP